MGESAHQFMRQVPISTHIAYWFYYGLRLYSGIRLFQ